MPDVVVVDHHDSYTWNLVHLIAGDPGRIAVAYYYGEPTTAATTPYFSHILQSFDAMSATPHVTDTQVSDIPAYNWSTSGMMGLCARALSTPVVGGVYAGLACSRSTDVWGIAADAQIYGVAGLFSVFFALWLAKCVRDWRAGRLLAPSVLLIGLTIAIGFVLPLFPNSDVAFQGFNVWHSVQYLALVWFLMAMRKERGELDNRLVAEMNGPDRVWRFYGLAVALTVAAGALVLVIHAAFGVSLQQAYYIVILSTLLQHYYLDHLQFTKLGDMLGSGERLLGGRAA